MCGQAMVARGRLEMEIIIRVVRRARRRLVWQSAAAILARGLIVLFAFACLLILAEKLFFLGRPLLYAGAGVAAVILIITAVLAVIRAPGAGKAAVEVDDRFALSERISSAIAVQHDPSPMARAVVADARGYARNVPVAEGFPMHVPRAGWVAFGIAAVALALLYFMPQFDLAGRRKALLAAAKEKKLAQRQAKRMRRTFERLKKRIPVNPPPDVKFHLEKMKDTIDELEKGKITRADALSEFTKLDDALKDAQSRMAKRGLSPAQAKKNFGEAQQLADALAKQDLKKAADALEQLAQRIQQGDLNEEQRKKLRDALNRLCKGLAQTAGPNEGRNPNKALQQALRKMAAQLGEMQINAEKLQQALQDAQVALQDMKDMQELLRQMRAMCKACKGAGKGGAKQVPGAAGAVAGIFNAETRQPGPGMGGAGIGRGGRAPVEPGNVGFDSDLVKGKLQSGRAVGSYFVNGRQLKGEAKADYIEVVGAARSEADEAVEKERIPRAYQDYVHEYFSGMTEE